MAQDLSRITGQNRNELKHKGAWLDVNEPQVIFFQGKRKAGKGVGVDEIVAEMHKAGITILHLWAARNNENWYYALVKGCKAFWDKWREEHKEQLKAGTIEEPLHCNCHKPIPISAMVPKGVAEKMNMDEVARFNGEFWESWEEYEIAWNNGDLTDYIPKQPWIDITKVRKPAHLRGKTKPFYPLIKIKPFTIPKITSKGSQDKFWKEFTDIVLEARKEQRIVVINPMMFFGTDKFHTVSYILNNIYKITQKYFPPLEPADVGKTSRDKMTKIEKSWHKLAVVLGEIKTLSPSSKLNPESGAGESKKALYNMIGEARHWQCWLVSDYQAIEDLFVGVKYQSDVYILKRATAKLLGDDWKHLFPEIDREREKIFAQMGGKNPKSLFIADKYWPELPHMPDNKGYVIIDDEINRLQEFVGGSWHHKHTREQFTKDFGIHLPDELLENNKSENENDDKNSSKSASSGKSKRKLQVEIYPDIDHYVVKQKLKYPEIKEKLNEDYKNFPEKLELVKAWEPDSMGQSYRRWKKKQKKKEE